jgi:twitching motility protein PilT
LTIEDPLEFIFTDKKSIFTQREVWRDVKSFHEALKSALREDPNVIMIWELRDHETVKSALELAETWHLVISTLHTWNSSQSINRLISFFPLESQDFVRNKLAFTLKWVLSQRLIPKVWWWRIWIFELLLLDTAVKNLIREWNIDKIKSVIDTSWKSWMISMNKYAEKLRDHWLVEEKDYINFFTED